MSTRLPAHPFTTAVPTGPVSGWYLAALGLAQFGIYVAILSPVYVSMQLKAQVLDPADPASVIAVALPIGSLGAIIGNPLFGALSDRTRTRIGRRRPWLLGGILVLLGGLSLVAFSPNVPTLAAAWLVCQLGSNAAYSAMMASWADNVPMLQRGRASSVIGLSQNVAILTGTYAAVLLVGNLPLLFILPGTLGVLCVTVYVLVTPDRLPDLPPKPFSWLTILRTFWTNPITHRDYGLAWWSRFLIILSMFLFTTFRLLYMEDHLGLAAKDATAAVAFGVLLYTFMLLIGTAISGWLSDRLQRRKMFVGGATVLFGVGLVILAGAGTVTVFYIAEAVMGLAYGTYVAVDNALVVDVLPDKDKPGKDLGVMNIANSLPQSFAPALGALLLSAGAGDNYPVLLSAAGIIAATGALVILPIRSVR